MSEPTEPMKAVQARHVPAEIGERGEELRIGEHRGQPLARAGTVGVEEEDDRLPGPSRGREGPRRGECAGLPERTAQDAPVGRDDPDRTPRDHPRPAHQAVPCGCVRRP